MLHLMINPYSKQNISKYGGSIWSQTVCVFHDEWDLTTGGAIKMQYLKYYSMSYDSEGHTASQNQSAGLQMYLVLRAGRAKVTVYNE